MLISCIGLDQVGLSLDVESHLDLDLSLIQFEFKFFYLKFKGWVICLSLKAYPEYERVRTKVYDLKKWTWTTKFRLV